MNIEEANLIVQTVVAACAVAGVFVAAWLGQKSTSLALKSAVISREAADIAMETQKRAEKDYLSARADFIAANLSDVMDRVAEFRAEIHIFWKENPRKLLDSIGSGTLTQGRVINGVEDHFLEQRIEFLDQQRLMAEVKVHGSIYKLNSAGRRLEDSVLSAEHLPVHLDSNVRDFSAEDTVAFLKILLRSVYPHYFSLISEEVPPEPHEEDFVEWFFDQLDMSVDTDADREALKKAQEWMLSRVKSDTKYNTGDLTQTFIEHFALHQLVDEVSKITRQLHKSAAPSGLLLT